LRVPQTQSTFHQHARRNAFRHLGARQQSRSFARWNPRLRRNPNSPGHPDAKANAINLGGELQLNWEKLSVIGRDRDSFKTLVDRKIRGQRRDERRLAEQRSTKHQLQARKSCVADARSYRVAGVFPAPPPAAAQFDWKTLIPVARLNKVRSAWLKKFRDHQLER